MTVRIYRFAYFKITLVLAILFVSIIFYRNIYYIIDFNKSQDLCRFGYISNKEYLNLKADAANLARIKWPSLRGNEEEVRILLNERVRDLVGNNLSIYKRIAAMHAVLRHLNGYLSQGNMAQYKSDFYLREAVDEFGNQSSIWFAYNVPSLSFGNLGFFFNEELLYTYVIISYDKDIAKVENVRRNGDVGTTVIFSNLFAALIGKGFPISGLSHDSSQCPPLPSERWAAAFENWNLKENGAINEH